MNFFSVASSNFGGIFSLQGSQKKVGLPLYQTGGAGPLLGVLPGQPLYHLPCLRTLSGLIRSRSTAPLILEVFHIGRGDVRIQAQLVKGRVKLRVRSEATHPDLEEYEP